MEKLIDLIDQLKSRCIENELMIMEQASLTPAEYNGILALDPDEFVCGSTLSQKMNLSPSRASRVIDKLVRNGYLVRENDAQDRRKCTICLAEKGIKVKKRIDKIKKECESRVRDKLSPIEIEQFALSLKKVNEAI